MTTESEPEPEHPSVGHAIDAVALQLAARVGDVDGNLSHFVDAALALDGNVDLIVVPETFATGYDLTRMPVDLRGLAEPLDGPTVAAARAVAEARDATVVIGMLERGDGDALYDSAVIVRPGGAVHPYRKTHLYPPEREHFAPGDQLAAVDGGPYVLGVMICFEHAFPEIATTLALDGATIFVIPSAVPKGYEYLLTLRTRARGPARPVERGLPLVARVEEIRPRALADHRGVPVENSTGRLCRRSIRTADAFGGSAVRGRTDPPQHSWTRLLIHLARHDGSCVADITTCHQSASLNKIRQRLIGGFVDAIDALGILRGFHNPAHDHVFHEIVYVEAGSADHRGRHVRAVHRRVGSADLHHERAGDHRAVHGNQPDRPTARGHERRFHHAAHGDRRGPRAGDDLLLPGLVHGRSRAHDHLAARQGRPGGLPDPEGGRAGPEGVPSRRAGPPGRNGAGQLGDGTTTDRPGPTAVSGAHRFQTIGTNAHHTCGLTFAGEAYCWGFNEFGQLGSGNADDSSTPRLVGGGRTWVALDVGFSHTCGIVPDGSAYCWGRNHFGQLGVGDSVGGGNQTLPFPMAGEITWVSLNLGGYFGCGLQAQTDAAFCWGYNGSWQLGGTAPDDCADEGTTTNCALSPFAVTGGLSFASISAHTQHTCGLSTDGVAYCWGSGTMGQLGNGEKGTQIYATQPVMVAGQP